MDKEFATQWFWGFMILFSFTLPNILLMHRFTKLKKRMDNQEADYPAYKCPYQNPILASTTPPPCLEVCPVYGRMCYRWLLCCLATRMKQREEKENEA